jgi:hypothetical protein
MLLLFGVILCKQVAKMRYDVLESLLEGDFLWRRNLTCLNDYNMIIACSLLNNRRDFPMGKYEV